MNQQVANQDACYHCGNEITSKNKIEFDEKQFCCNGCQTVYEIFQKNDLSCYYDFENNPGTTPNDILGKYDFLENESIVKKLLEFEEDNTHIVLLYIPTVHCSSCIWILENLQKLQKGIYSSTVNFPKKTVRIQYNPNETSLKDIVNLLSSIGYEPYISLDSVEQPKKTIQKDLLYKIGVAFFSFGNIMLLSFPEYFEVDEFWINQYKNFFRWLIFGLALPPFFYSASIYYVSAYKSIKSGLLNIDIPIALGIIVMFVRSVVDILFGWGQGFFDSMTGLIFFMLLGKLFQQKTYEFLSFERDYKSYFPIAVTRITPQKTHESIQVYDIKKGDRLFLRNQELLPVDGILMSEKASLDYSFVTGESQAVSKKSGDKCFAGGKILGAPIEIEVLFSVEQSYLTQLWSNDVFKQDKEEQYQTITDKISRYFTPILLLIAFLSFGFWLFKGDTKTAFNVFTAVLIVACPCALALTAPFTLGNALRILGIKKVYLKNAHVIEKMAKIKTIVFDKTGTITSADKVKIIEKGSFDLETKNEIYHIVKGSNHPLSRQLAKYLTSDSHINVNDFDEVVGKGLIGEVNNNVYKVGSATWVKGMNTSSNNTIVYVSKNNLYLGSFEFRNQYRNNLKQLMNIFSNHFKIKLLSGDNNGEQATLETLLPYNTPMYFDQKPEDKLQKIKSWQVLEPVMMIGDGLNDAGALAQSDVGLVISEDVNVFSPACDGIVAAEKFESLPFVMQYAKKVIKIIYASFTISILYNIVGLSFAITGHLSPLVAAIIMPLSTITIVSFVTLMTNIQAYLTLRKSLV